MQPKTRLPALSRMNGSRGAVGGAGGNDSISCCNHKPEVNRLSLMWHFRGAAAGHQDTRALKGHRDSADTLGGQSAKLWQRMAAG